jgi:excisionase family DNA binding protein
MDSKLLNQRPYTVEELAEHWQVSRETIYALIRKFVKGDPDGLPAFTIGGKLWRIKRETVEQWQSAGGSMKSGDTGSDGSLVQSPNSTKPSSCGETATARTDEDLVSSARRRVESRLMHSLANSGR